MKSIFRVQYLAAIIIGTTAGIQGWHRVTRQEELLTWEQERWDMVELKDWSVIGDRGQGCEFQPHLDTDGTPSLILSI